ncbi:MAG TPA: nicotinamide-nucleotide adenylyltransferase [Natrialbaceae archaeon]|nr:nicotinamide-nucleotide adenylyltransferase [Natrialbaceae archaeon]
MRGFFPGRFQPFHRGHRAFVQQVASEVDEVVVGIGSAQASHTGRNPFTAGERVSMIHAAIEDVEAPTYVIPIEDIDRYSLWPAHVQSLCPAFQAIYTNNPLVGRVCREAGLDVRGVDLVDRDRFRGTEIRRRMVEDEPWRDLVPDGTAEAIDDIDGVTRLRRIVEHDQHAVDGSL